MCEISTLDINQVDLLIYCFSIQYLNFSLCILKYSSASINLHINEFDLFIIDLLLPTQILTCHEIEY